MQSLELRQEVEARQLFAVDPLKHSCRPCGGIWSDLKKLRKRYVSDFRDALHFQVFISIVFLFISFIAPAIAFGGLMEDVTDRRIGATETLVATGLCGIVYGLFAVQPLSILAFTGPLLLFEKIVFEVREIMSHTTFTIHTSLHTVHTFLYTIHISLHTIHTSLHTIHTFLYTIHISLHTIHTSPHTFHIFLHTIHIPSRQPRALKLTTWSGVPAFLSC